MGYSSSQQRNAAIESNIKTIGIDSILTIKTTVILAAKRDLSYTVLASCFAAVFDMLLVVLLLLFFIGHTGTALLTLGSGSHGSDKKATLEKLCGVPHWCAFTSRPVASTSASFRCQNGLRNRTSPVQSTWKLLEQLRCKCMQNTNTTTLVLISSTNNF